MRHPPVLLRPASASTTPIPPSSASSVTPSPVSTFSASAPSLTGTLPSARRYAAVRLLTGETLQFDVEVKSKGKELYAAVARHMSSLGMKSSDIFGLAIQIEGEYLFLDPDNKLGKYAPKGWKSSHASGLDNAGNPLLVLHFRVKFYVDSHLLIRDRVTRQHYYLQLRENVLRHGQPASEESFFRLAALALQADLGDFDPDQHRAAYFDPQLYFPHWILERVGIDYVVQNMPAMHRDHQCLPTSSAQLLYIREASSGHTHYGLHLYRLRSSKKESRSTERSTERECRSSMDRTATFERNSTKSKSDKSESNSKSLERDCNDRTSEKGSTPSSTGLDHIISSSEVSTGTVWLGICGRGIDIYEEEDSVTKTLRATFQWPNIGKLYFERKKFEIRAVGCPESRKYTYYTSSDDKSKHLLYLCRVTHQFSMAMQPKLAELRKLEEEANQHYRESPLLHEDGTTMAWCESVVGNGSSSSSSVAQDQLSLRSLRGYASLGQNGKVHNDQRISVISNTSSNTTSGIVSDKVQSVDESEDDLEIDIMNAPATHSLESLALSHLRDSCDSLPMDLDRRDSNRCEQKEVTHSTDSNSILPRRLAGPLARLARVGRSSNKNCASNKGTPAVTSTTPNEMSRNGSLHSSSSQQSSSTVHSRSRSNTRVPVPPWPCNLSSSTVEIVNANSSWLRLGTVDVIDGVASLRISATSGNENAETEQRNVTSSEEPAEMEEENQYWYSCDDDVSETCSTSAENCTGVMCADCRLVRGGSEHDCCSPTQNGHRHEKGPSESSSLCVSVDHTAQNSTLSDCHSYFHSHVSSVDSSLGSSHAVQSSSEIQNVPLAATVSALSSSGSLRSMRSGVTKSDEDNSSVDYSVQSGPVTADSVGLVSNAASPKLDFTVTSAVPNTGTYPRRSTVSTTLDTDSDYVQLPPLEDSSYVFMEPMQPKSAAIATVAAVNQLCIRSRTPVSSPAVEKRPVEFGEDPSSLPAPLPPKPPPKPAAAAASEATARFITTKPTINILQAHASAAPNTTPSFAAPAQHLIPPPPYDIRQHPQYQSQIQQQQQQQQSYHPAQVQAQFQALEQSSSPQYQYTSAPVGYSQQDSFIIEPPPPPPPYPVHLQVQAPLTTANLGLHLSQQSVSSAASKHSMNSSLNRSVEAQNFGQIATAYPAYAEDVTTVSEGKASSTYGAADQALVPVIGKNNYLDVHASNTLSRRPQQQQQQQQPQPQTGPPFEQYLGIPPPPQYPGKPTLATVYTNQVTQSQIEQFKAQLYSDVDYVIYPHKDPSVSRQEYMDAKQGALLAQGQCIGSLTDLETAYLPPPPPYRAPKSSTVYRSAPSVYAPAQTINGGVLSSITPSTQQQLQQLSYTVRPTAHYSSNQSLSSSNYSSSYSTSNYSSNYSAQVSMAYVPYPSLNAKYLSCQSLASSHSSNPSGYSASTQSLTGSYEPIGAVRKLVPPVLSRVHSEESVLNYDLPEVTTLSSAIARQDARCILLPPPPYRKQTSETSSTNSTPASAPSTTPSNELSSSDQKLPNRGPLDIKTLREKSRNLDLPLISALCNDPSLLNQTKRNTKNVPSNNNSQQSSVSNIQSMPLPPTPLEAAQGKTTGQPPPKRDSHGQSRAYVMPKHPGSTGQPEAVPPRRLALQTAAKRSSAANPTQSRPISWHLDNSNWSAMNIPVESTGINGDKKPPPPPPNSNSAIEAKLQQLQKAAVAIATGPGSIIAEDGKIAKALNLPAFAKSVKNSYVVSPSRKLPVSGLYAVTELGKPPTGVRKVAPTAFSHPHNTNSNSSKVALPLANPTSMANGKNSFSLVP